MVRDRPRYAHVRIGKNRFSLDDMGIGPRVMALEWHENQWFEVAASCAVHGPDDLRTVEGPGLHPMLVEALKRSRELGGREVVIRVAKGRWEAPRDSIRAAK